MARKPIETVDITAREGGGPAPFAFARSSGWTLVVTLGCTTILSYGTTQYLFGVLVVPLSAAFGWNRAGISGAYALSLLVAGLLGVPVGYLVDRYGARWLMTLGSLLAGCALLGLSQINTLWQLYLFWAGGIGVAMALILYPVTFTVVTTWFVKERARAFAVLTVLGGLASPIFLPLAGWLIPQWGWRTTLLAFGLAHFLFALPLHAGLVKRAPAYDTRPALASEQDDTAFSVRQSLRSFSFWTLSSAFSLALLGNAVLFAHQVAFLITRGYGAVLAAALTGGVGLASLPGRLLLNLLSERLSPQRLLAFCHWLQAAGVVALILAPSFSWVLAYVILYGAAFGAISPLRASVMADHFGREAYGAITGIQGILIAFSTAIGPLAAGWLYDLLGHYEVAFWLCAAGFVLAALGVWFTPLAPTDTPVRRRV